MRFETKAIHSGAGADDETGAISPPIHLSTTFERTVDGAPSHGFSYIRDGNPTQAKSGGGAGGDRFGVARAGVCLGDGSGDVRAAVAAAGSHLILPDDGYYGVRALAAEYLPRWGVECDLVAMDDLDAVRAAVTPNDARDLVRDAVESADEDRRRRRAGVDRARRERDARSPTRTFATPALQRPIEQGADVVMHSTTKYLGGHSDVQGGSLAFARRDAFATRSRTAARSPAAWPRRSTRG